MKCPFKVTKIFTHKDMYPMGTTFIKTVKTTEYLSECEGKECMAYENGKCKRLEPNTIVTNRRFLNGSR